MASKSTLRRNRKGLAQVELDWSAATWAEVMALTGAVTKRAAVETLLRRSIEAKKREQAWKAECARARAEALSRLGENNEL